MFRPGERAKFQSVPFFIALAFRFPICRHVDLSGAMLAPLWRPWTSYGFDFVGGVGLNFGFMLVPKLALQQVILAYGLALGGLVGLREA